MHEWHVLRQLAMRKKPPEKRPLSARNPPCYYADKLIGITAPKACFRVIYISFHIYSHFKPMKIKTIQLAITYPNLN